VTDDEEEHLSRRIIRLWKSTFSSDNYKDVRWGIKFVNGNVGYESKVMTIPQWCAFWVPRLVKEFYFWDEAI